MPPCSSEEDRRFFWVTAKPLHLPGGREGYRGGGRCFEEAAAGLKRAGLSPLPATLKLNQATLAIPYPTFFCLFVFPSAA